MTSPTSIEDNVTPVSDRQTPAGLASEEVELALGRMHASDVGGVDDSLAGLFDKVAADTCDKKADLRSRLGELPTRWRIAIGLGSALSIAVLTLLTMGIRGDLTSQVLGRYALLLTGLTGLAGAAMAMSLRGLHQGKMWRWRWLVAGVAIGTPIVLALLPSIWGGANHGMAIPETAPNSVHVPCLMLGCITGAMVATVVWLLQRGPRMTITRAIAAAAAGGLTAFAILQLSCPANDVTHLLVGHAVIGLGLSVLAVAGGWVLRRGQG